MILLLHFRNLFVDIPEPHAEKAHGAGNGGNNEEEEGLGIQSALRLGGKRAVVAARCQAPSQDGTAKTGADLGADGADGGDQALIALAGLQLQIVDDNTLL